LQEIIERSASPRAEQRREVAGSNRQDRSGHRLH
jgi:hypothetical protein